MVVKLTQKQADYLETFGTDRNKAVYYISRWGFSFNLKDGNGKLYGTNEETPFTLDEKEKMLNAIINGYEVFVPKFKFYNYSDWSNDVPLYYAGELVRLTFNEEKALEVKKDSKEYVALKRLGFYCAEV